jgi:hypothetical protein
MQNKQSENWEMDNNLNGIRVGKESQLESLDSKQIGSGTVPTVHDISISEDKKIGNVWPIVAQNMSHNGTEGDGNHVPQPDIAGNPTIIVPETVAASSLADSAAKAPNPFDPARYRRAPNLSAAAGVKKIVTVVPVGKPHKESFFRTHPDPEYRLDVGIIELKLDREFYLVDPELEEALVGESTFSKRLLLTAQTRQGVLFLWPLRYVKPGERDSWGESANKAAVLSATSWIRMQANMHVQAYDVSQVAASDIDPEWAIPKLEELLKIAFGKFYIDSMSHPVLKRLRGEA